MAILCSKAASVDWLGLSNLECFLCLAIQIKLGKNPSRINFPADARDLQQSLDLSSTG
jgi:hypothetical protein